MTAAATLRVALADLSVPVAHLPDQPIAPSGVLLGRTQRAALDTDRPLVVAPRGLGKSLLAHALCNAAFRERAATELRAPGLRSMECVMGFNGRSLLRDLLRDAATTEDPERLWTLVLLIALWSPALVQEAPTGLALLSAWHHDPATHPEPAEVRAAFAQVLAAPPPRLLQLLQALEAHLTAAGRRTVVVFDALEQLRGVPQGTDGLLQALLRRAASPPSGSLRLKLFISSEQLADDTLFRIPKGERLRSGAAWLKLEGEELLTLLFQGLQGDAAFDALEAATPIGPRRAEALLSALCGPSLGPVERPVAALEWLLTRLTDARGQAAPRTFVLAFREAARTSIAGPLPIATAAWSRAIHHAGRDRIMTLREDAPWLEDALRPLRGMAIPVEQGALLSRWRDDALPLPAERLSRMEAFGILACKSDQVDIPELFRASIGGKRRGAMGPRSMEVPDMSQDSKGSLTLDGVFAQHLHGLTRPVLKASGWSTVAQRNPYFVEPPLKLRAGFGDTTAPIWLIAAPGAVGKSTLAAELAARTGAIHVDLAAEQRLGGYFLTGRLDRLGLRELWKAEQIAVLIDALDEARMDSQQANFEDFLDDVLTLSHGRSVPTLLLGRTAVMDEVWLVLKEKNLDCPIIEIQNFDQTLSVEVILRSLERHIDKMLREKNTQETGEQLATALERFRSVYKEKAREFVGALWNIEGEERFGGYTPVLDLAAARLLEENNVQVVESAIDLRRLVDDLLLRDARKLRAKLPDTIPLPLHDRLYTPAEQRLRLATLVLEKRTIHPDLPVALDAEQRKSYDDCVRKFLEVHPLLDGTGADTANAVFAGALLAFALRSGNASLEKAALIRLRRKPNPFLKDFYLEPVQGQTPFIPLHHVAVIFDALWAAARSEESPRLYLEAKSDDQQAEGEITYGEDRNDRLTFRTDHVSTLTFSRTVRGVDIDAPEMEVVLYSPTSLELVAPVRIAVGTLVVDCEELVATTSDLAGQSSEDLLVLLEASKLEARKLARPPLRRGNAELRIDAPEAAHYPFHSFAIPSPPPRSPQLDEALRALRRLILTFRSHKKGSLARFKDKVESRRMTKGEVGERLQEQLLGDGVLTFDGTQGMYFLSPQLLAEKVGASYQDLKAKRFSPAVIAYLEKLLK